MLDFITLGLVLIPLFFYSQQNATETLRDIMPPSGTIQVVTKQVVTLLLEVKKKENSRDSSGRHKIVVVLL